jgi:hypothetical protein
MRGMGGPESREKHRRLPSPRQQDPATTLSTSPQPTPAAPFCSYAPADGKDAPRGGSEQGVKANIRTGVKEELIVKHNGG